MIKAFVCGHPVAHSRSPLIHGYWLRTLGIDGSYGRIDVAPEAIGDFLADLPASGHAGGNFTIPHKEAAFAAASRRTEAAELIGAVNTIWIEDGALAGDNTDAPGFAGNLDDRAPGWRKGRTATVIGAGGAARAVIHAVREAGYGEIRVVNRTVSRAQELANRFGAFVRPLPAPEMTDALADSDLLVNTTSLGMDGNADLPADVSALPSRAIVTDIVYVPLVTPLLAAAKARGLVAVDGLGMLLHQAVPGFERWFGVRPTVTDELRQLVIADMAAHS